MKLAFFLCSCTKSQIITYVPTAIHFYARIYNIHIFHAVSLTTIYNDAFFMYCNCYQFFVTIVKIAIRNVMMIIEEKNVYHNILKIKKITS